MAAIIIDPADGREPYAYDRDVVMILADLPKISADFIYSRLKKMGSGYYNYQKLTLGDSGAGSAQPRRARDDARSSGLGRNGHDAHRPAQRHRQGLHLHRQRRRRGRELDRAVQSRRTRQGAGHQRLGDDALRCAGARPADDDDPVRRPVHRARRDRRVPHRCRQDLRLHRPSARGPRLYRLCRDAGPQRLRPDQSRAAGRNGRSAARAARPSAPQPRGDGHGDDGRLASLPPAA